MEAVSSALAETAMPAGEKVKIRPPCAGTVFDLLFDPRLATAVIISGEGRTGKTLMSVQIAHYLATKLHIYVLTNIIFLQKTRSGPREVFRPDERIRHVKTMRELWYEYALICKEYKSQHPGEQGGPIVVALLDEWTKYMSRLTIYENVCMAALKWWGEIGKYQLIPAMICQKMANAPRQLLPYMKWHIQKSEQLTWEYNAAKGRNYHYKELAFVIKIRLGDELEKRKEEEFHLEDVAGVMEFHRGPWTGAYDDIKIGEICYDARGSADLEMGTVRSSEDWFPAFMKHISSCPGMMVPDRILEFFETGPDQSTQLDRVPRTKVATHYDKIYKEELPLDRIGRPILTLVDEKGKRRRHPMSLRNYERIFRCPKSSLADEMEKLR